MIKKRISLDREIILDYLGGSNEITRILKRWKGRKRDDGCIKQGAAPRSHEP